MSKKTVKRCVRPQCLEVYSEDSSNKYCDCGALLQVVEIEVPNNYNHKPRKEVDPSTGAPSGNKPDSRVVQPRVENTKPSEKPLTSETDFDGGKREGFDFFDEGTSQVSVKPSPVAKPEPLGYLYLIPENEDEEEVEYRLGRKTIIGRSSDPIAVDVDLSQFGGIISRKHALITCEADGFYITNLSENHSVHVNNKVVVSGQKMKLTSEDGIILSKKVLLQFEEGE